MRSTTGCSARREDTGSSRIRRQPARRRPALRHIRATIVHHGQPRGDRRAAGRDAMRADRRADADAGADRAARVSDRLHPDRSRRSRADLVGAAGDGRRHEDVAADARRRGARRRLDEGAHRGCAARSRSTADRASAAAMRFDRIGMRCAASAPPRARCLIAAAAAQWNVPASECDTSAHVVRHRGQRPRSRYGSLAARAATLTVPRDVPLKDPSRYRLIGTRVNGTDNHKVVTGQPLFGIDVRLPNMKFAAVAKCPVFNGRPVKIDATKARAGARRPRHRRDQRPRQPDAADARRRGGRRLDVGGVQGPRRARSCSGTKASSPPRATRSLTEQFQKLLAAPPATLHNSGRVDEALAVRGHRRRQHLFVPVRRRTRRSSRTTAPPTIATASVDPRADRRCR